MPSYRSPAEPPHHPGRPRLGPRRSDGPAGLARELRAGAGLPPAPPARPPVDEREVLTELAAGRLRSARRLVRAAAEAGDLVALVADTDARARGVVVDVPAIQVVVERVEAADPPGGRLRAWAQAVLAERLVLDADPDALAVAEEALAELAAVPQPTLPPLALRYARARLRRVVSAAWLLVPAEESRPELRETLDKAVAELLACGFVAEVHVTRGLSAGVVATGAGEDVVENHAQLADARAALAEDEESVWPVLLDHFLAVTCLEVGDVAGSLAALDRLDAWPGRSRRIEALAAYSRAFLRLVTGGPTDEAVAAVGPALAGVRRHDPRVAQALHAHMAHTLVDLGSPAAGHFARLESEMPVIGSVAALDRELLRLRVATVEGGGCDAGAAQDAVERLAAAGRPRIAGRQALRVAHDLARVGDVAGAAALHAWGRAQVPEGDRSTWWERWWSRPLAPAGGPVPATVPLSSGPTGPLPPAGGPPAAASAVPAEPVPVPAPVPVAAAAVVSLGVLRPSVEVAVGGAPVTLSESQARLLLVLALAHPAPVHVERASDLLWPDEVLETTRPRLNSLVHRLRRALGVGDAVVRSGDRIALRPAVWDVDLWRFRAALSPPDGGPAGAAARVAALARVAGNLAEAQFPYDEPLVTERHRLASDWLRRARAACAAGHATPADLGPAATALGLDPGDV